MYRVVPSLLPRFIYSESVLTPAVLILRSNKLWLTTTFNGLTLTGTTFAEHTKNAALRYWSKRGEVGDVVGGTRSAFFCCHPHRKTRRKSQRSVARCEHAIYHTRTKNRNVVILYFFWKTKIRDRNAQNVQHQRTRADTTGLMSVFAYGRFLLQQRVRSVSRPVPVINYTLFKKNRLTVPGFNYR